MPTFSIDEKVGGVLVPLHILLERVQSFGVDCWSVRGLELLNGRPFGIPLEEFERATDSLALGIVLTPSELSTLAASGTQVLDGTFTAISFAGKELSGNEEGFMERYGVFSLRCIDSGLWEVSTSSAEIEGKLRDALLK